MKKRHEFSKVMVVFLMITMLLAVSFITLRTLDIAELAVREKFSGALPYLVAVITPAWASIATIMGFYFNKAKAENLEKIKKSAPKRDC